MHVKHLRTMPLVAIQINCIVICLTVFFSACVDSNSDDSDSDMSDVDEIDSDLEAESRQKYDRVISKEDMTALKSHIKGELAPGEKRARAPNEGLKLNFVHG